jgi:hypothetical protein
MPLGVRVSGAGTLMGGGGKARGVIDWGGKLNGAARASPFRVLSAAEGDEGN